MEKISDEKLFEYIDGNLSPEEYQFIENTLQASTTLRKRLVSLQQMHTLMSQLPLEKAPNNIASNIMANLEQEKPKLWWRELSMNNLLVLFLSLISVGFISYALSIGIVVPEFTIISSGFQSSALEFINVRNVFDSTLIKTITFLYAFLVLLFLDKVILQPYFRGKTR